MDCAKRWEDGNGWRKRQQVLTRMTWEGWSEGGLWAIAEETQNCGETGFSKDGGMIPECQLPSQYSTAPRLSWGLLPSSTRTHPKSLLHSWHTSLWPPSHGRPASQWAGVRAGESLGEPRRMVPSGLALGSWSLLSLGPQCKTIHPCPGTFGICA